MGTHKQVLDQGHPPTLQSGTLPGFSKTRKGGRKRDIETQPEEDQGRSNPIEDKNQNWLSAAGRDDSLGSKKKTRPQLTCGVDPNPKENQFRAPPWNTASIIAGSREKKK